ncbi:MAG: 16S rRNA (adenine(1518)-N(6)/adenine(1519)-N(6))-dimethyltransferase RsmA [Pseudomonadota bacterium]|nr:16S rRNA (adenine(1518)-N(6)/adenine(1519)-N(6))-dimethyltransferase RsmA [Pseudomonadota bacterium]
MIPAAKLLKQHAVPPRRRLSQSFLTDDNVARRIVGAADLGGRDTVLEIGAGHGILTRLMAPRVRHLLAVEIDPRLVAVLQAELGGRDNVLILEADILKLDLAAVPAGRGEERKKIVGNIPYGIATEILFRLLAWRRLIVSATLMIQKELAQRLTAAPGTKAYGIPTVLLAMYARIGHLFDVSPSCFHPRPRVVSSVISLTFRDRPQVDLADENHFIRTVKAAFAQRRKTLANNLRAAPELGCGRGELEKVLEKCGLSGRIRAEMLPVETLGLLSNELLAARRGVPSSGEEGKIEGRQGEEGANG